MTAIQDLVPHNHCYGCGPDNPQGMQIKSYWDGKVSTCTYLPRPEQCAGPTHLLYGGTIASLFDCHSICTAMAHQYELDGRGIGEGEPLWCVTGSLNVRYLKPTPIDKAVELRAKIAATASKKTTVHCEMFSGDIKVAESEVIAIRVPDDWRE
jgi:acyl-coenzyme A thioesterase PaaI-like protein